MSTIQFTVYGNAQSAGSKRAFVPTNKNTGQPFRRAGGGIVVSVVDDNAKSKDWKKLVAMAAQQHRPATPIEGAVRLTLVFVRVRAADQFNSKGELNKKGLGKPYPISKPDVLKLARGIEDALTGIVWKDDAQIVDERLTKRWGDAACVEITVEPMTAQLELAGVAPTAEQKPW